MVELKIVLVTLSMPETGHRIDTAGAHNPESSAGQSSPKLGARGVVHVWGCCFCEGTEGTGGTALIYIGLFGGNRKRAEGTGGTK